MWGSVPTSQFRGFTSLWMAKEFLQGNSRLLLIYPVLGLGSFGVPWSWHNVLVRRRVVLMPKGIRIPRMASEVFLTCCVVVEWWCLGLGSGKSNPVLTRSDVV